MSDQERTSSSESFSGRIKLVRYSFDLSQREVAEIAGTFIQNVSRWEKKTFEPSAEVKKRIAEAKEKEAVKTMMKIRINTFTIPSS